MPSNNFVKSFKVIFINLILFIFLFVFVDLSLGYFYGNLQFSHFLNSKRLVNKKISYIFDGKKKKYKLPKRLFRF